MEKERQGKEGRDEGVERLRGRRTTVSKVSKGKKK